MRAYFAMWCSFVRATLVTIFPSLTFYANFTITLIITLIVFGLRPRCTGYVPRPSSLGLVRGVEFVGVDDLGSHGNSVARTGIDYFTLLLQAEVKRPSSRGGGTDPAIRTSAAVLAHRILLGVGAGGAAIYYNEFLAVS